MGEELRGRGIGSIGGQHCTREAVLEVVRTGDVVMIQSVRQLLTRAVIEQFSQWRCVVVLGIGYDSVEVAAATKRASWPRRHPPTAWTTWPVTPFSLLIDCFRHLAWQDH